MQATPAGFPLGIPGIGELIEGAIQQAPQLLRHSILSVFINGGAIVEKNSPETKKSGERSHLIFINRIVYFI